MNNWTILIVLIIVCAVIYPRWRRQAIIKRWFTSLSINKHHANYEQLFASVDGFALSRQARTSHDAMEYTYGEINFISFIALLSLTRPNSSTVFYDLGSGTGKAVLACAMVFNVQKSCGIELFSVLHQAALNQQQQLGILSDYHDKDNVIYFVNSNFLEADFSDATLLFINATALRPVKNYRLMYF